MAARRERERRRPSGERRYQFAPPEPDLAAEEALEQDEEAPEAVEATAARPRYDARARRAAATPARNAGRAHRPFSSYREEYAYVYGDLRRVGLGIGSLLAVLIVLYFLLPALVH